MYVFLYIRTQGTVLDRQTYHDNGVLVSRQHFIQLNSSPCR